MIAIALNQGYLRDELFVSLSLLHLEHLLFAKFFLLYLLVTIFADMLTASFATELFISLELSADLAVPTTFTSLLHSREISQKAADTFQAPCSSTHRGCHPSLAYNQRGQILHVRPFSRPTC